MELYHHGIKGQRWGVRRYQNADGTLTAAGKKRYRGENGDITRYVVGSKEYLEVGKKVDNILYDDGSPRAIERIQRHGNITSYKIDRAIEQIGKSKREQALEDAVSKLRREYGDISSKNKWPQALEDAVSKLRREYEDLANDPETIALMKKRKDVTKKYYAEFRDKRASVVLRELGYEDTKAAREFVQSMNDYMYDHRLLMPRTRKMMEEQSSNERRNKS